MSIDKTQIEKRPATRADLQKFYGQVPTTVWAWAWHRGDDVVAVAGWHRAEGLPMVFSDMIEGLSKLAIWRQAVEFSQMVPDGAYCIASDGAEKFLTALGWAFVKSDPEVGEVFQWRNSSL